MKNKLLRFIIFCSALSWRIQAMDGTNVVPQSTPAQTLSQGCQNPGSLPGQDDLIPPDLSGIENAAFLTALGESIEQSPNTAISAPPVPSKSSQPAPFGRFLERNAYVSTPPSTTQQPYAASGAQEQSSTPQCCSGYEQQAASQAAAAVAAHYQPQICATGTMIKITGPRLSTAQKTVKEASSSLSRVKAPTAADAQSAASAQPSLVRNAGASSVVQAPQTGFFRTLIPLRRGELARTEPGQASRLSGVPVKPSSGEDGAQGAKTDQARGVVDSARAHSGGAFGAKGVKQKSDIRQEMEKKLKQWTEAAVREQILRGEAFALEKRHPEVFGRGYFENAMRHISMALTVSATAMRTSFDQGLGDDLAQEADDKEDEEDGRPAPKRSCLDGDDDDDEEEDDDENDFSNLQKNEQLKQLPAGVKNLSVKKCLPTISHRTQTVICSRVRQQFLALVKKKGTVSFSNLSHLIGNKGDSWTQEQKDQVIFLQDCSDEAFIKLEEMLDYREASGKEIKLTKKMVDDAKAAAGDVD